MTSDANDPSKPNDQPPREGFTKEELSHALKAFKKRLKLMRLDDESKIGGRAMSGGNRSGIVGIRPPSPFPKEIWDELVRQGKLKDAGRGLYEISSS